MEYVGVSHFDLAKTSGWSPRKLLIVLAQCVRLTPALTRRLRGNKMPFPLRKQ